MFKLGKDPSNMRGPFLYQNMQEFWMRVVSTFLVFSLAFPSFSALAQTSTPDTLSDATSSQGVFVGEEQTSKTIENKGDIASPESAQQAVKLTYPELMR